MQQRIIGRARFRVVPIGMTLAEGSASAVLTGQSYRNIFEPHVQPKLKFGLQRRGVILSKHAPIEQLPFVDLRDRWPLIDPGVEIRLGEARLIYFLMAVFAVAIHVDHKVASEFLPKIER